MMTMTRICFDRNDAELGVAALREAGYTVLTHIFFDEPDHTFVEASREVDTTAESELDAVNVIVEPFDGFVSDAGPVPSGHRPFEYETEVWRPDLPPLDDEPIFRSSCTEFAALSATQGVAREATPFCFPDRSNDNDEKDRSGREAFRPLGRHR